MNRVLILLCALVLGGASLSGDTVGHWHYYMQREAIQYLARGQPRVAFPYADEAWAFAQIDPPPHLRTWAVDACLVKARAVYDMGQMERFGDVIKECASFSARTGADPSPRLHPPEIRSAWVQALLIDPYPDTASDDR